MHPEHLGSLDGYEVIDWLGRGGMGIVFKGFDSALNRYVAIKVLAPHWAPGADTRRRFTREATPTCSATLPPWTEATFRAWCAGLSNAEAASLPRNVAVANSGMNWLEGNMTWTRYNHLLPPGSKSCANGLTWDGVAMTANSRHGQTVGLLLGDGSVRFVRYTIDAGIWRALGTIAGGELVPGDSF